MASFWTHSDTGKDAHKTRSLGSVHFRKPANISKRQREAKRKLYGREVAGDDFDEKQAYLESKPRDSTSLEEELDTIFPLEWRFARFGSNSSPESRKFYETHTVFGKDDLVRSLTVYQGERFANINAKLHSDHTKNNDYRHGVGSALDAKIMTRHIGNIHFAFRSIGWMSDNPLVLFRGQHRPYFKPTEVSKGDLYSSPSYVSTSRKYAAAKRFTDFESNCCLSILVVAPHVPYIDMNTVGTGSRFVEHEVLLPANVILRYEKTIFFRNNYFSVSESNFKRLGEKVKNMLLSKQVNLDTFITFNSAEESANFPSSQTKYPAPGYAPHSPNVYDSSDFSEESVDDENDEEESGLKRGGGKEIGAAGTANDSDDADDNEDDDDNPNKLNNPNYVRIEVVSVHLNPNDSFHRSFFDSPALPPPPPPSKNENDTPIEPSNAKKRAWSSVDSEDRPQQQPPFKKGGGTRCRKRHSRHCRYSRGYTVVGKRRPRRTLRHSLRR